jgi:pimeloyl-ACP methyl ester carboxylesterase
VKHFVIYIPGLGDKRIRGQVLAVRTWKAYAVTSHLFHVRWFDKEPYAEKLDRLITMIDARTKEGYSVSLVGASAGGSLAINALAQRPRKIHKVVLIAGEINGKLKMSPGTYRHNPSFRESMDVVEESLAELDVKTRQRILSLRAVFDPVVTASDSIIKDAHNKVVATSGHALTIATQITLGARRWLRFIKQS